MAIALDTLAYARRLREAGFSEQQAEGQAEALAAAMTDTLATKQDLSELGGRIDVRFAATKQDLSELGRRIDLRFAATEQDLSEVRHEVQELQIRMEAGFSAAKESMRETELRLDARFDAKLADLERRVTVRMLAGIAAVSALVKLL